MDADDLRAQLGPGWSVQSTRSGVADVEAPEMTGFLGSTDLVLRGPHDARVTVVVMPLAADTDAATKAWSWAGDQFEFAVQENLGLVPGSDADPGEAAAVPGCRQATHTEGRTMDTAAAVGVTLCAADTTANLVVTATGEVLGHEGWAASDQVAAIVAKTLADVPIIPTHRFAGRGTTESGLYRYTSLNAPLVRPLTPGTLLRWTGAFAPSRDADLGTSWLKLRTADGREGWVPGAFLVPTTESSEGMNEP